MRKRYVGFGLAALLALSGCSGAKGTNGVGSGAIFGGLPDEFSFLQRFLDALPLMLTKITFPSSYRDFFLPSLTATNFTYYPALRFTLGGGACGAIAERDAAGALVPTMRESLLAATSGVTLQMTTTDLRNARGEAVYAYAPSDQNAIVFQKDRLMAYAKGNPAYFYFVLVHELLHRADAPASHGAAHFGDGPLASAMTGGCGTASPNVPVFTGPVGSDDLVQDLAVETVTYLYANQLIDPTEVIFQHVLAAAPTYLSVHLTPATSGFGPMNYPVGTLTVTNTSELPTPPLTVSTTNPKFSVTATIPALAPGQSFPVTVSVWLRRYDRGIHYSSIQATKSDGTLVASWPVIVDFTNFVP